MVLAVQYAVSERASGMPRVDARDAHGRGSNWIHPALEVRGTAHCGYGVFASKDIPAGVTVIVYGGVILTEAEFEALPEELQHFPFNIAEGFFLAPRNGNDLGVGERVNHSCEPNVGFSGQLTLVTLRDLRCGEEVTFDYATCVASDDGAFTMECACGAPSCRKVITGQDWRLAEVQKRLLPHYQPFLRERVLSTLQSGAGRQPMNEDRHESPEARAPRMLKGWRAVPRIVGVFILAALRNEWMAIPICVIAGIPSTIVTALLMTELGPHMRGGSWLQSEASFVAAFSLMTSVVGYVTYLLMYYLGMLLKERQDWIQNGRVERAALRRKLQVVKYDFLAHLPSDLWVMPMIGAAQGSMMLAGAPQLWSIIFAHTLSDIAYAMKEPLFWHGAKQLVAWRERLSSNTN